MYNHFIANFLASVAGKE